MPTSVFVVSSTSIHWFPGWLQPALDFGDSAITSLFPSTITSVASPLLPVKLGAQVLGRALDGYIASWVPAHRIGPGSATVPLPFYPDSPNLTHLSWPGSLAQKPNSLWSWRLSWAWSGQPGLVYSRHFWELSAEMNEHMSTHFTSSVLFALLRWVCLTLHIALGYPISFDTFQFCYQSLWGV